MKNYIPNFEEFINESQLNEAKEISGTINFLKKELADINVYTDKNYPSNLSKDGNASIYIVLDLNPGESADTYTLHNASGRSARKPNFQKSMENYANSLGASLQATREKGKGDNWKPTFYCNDKGSAEKIIQDVIMQSNSSLAKKATSEISKF
jgi:hypothetical protein